MYATNNEVKKAERTPLRNSLNTLDDTLSQMNIIGQEIITSLRGSDGPVVALTSPISDGSVNIAEQLTIKAQAVYEKLRELQELLG